MPGKGVETQLAQKAESNAARTNRTVSGDDTRTADVKNGPQNYSKWQNEKFDALVQQIDNELDTAKRKTFIRQAEAIMEQDPPLLPVAWEKMNDSWYTYVKGHTPKPSYFGIYDVVRWDTTWLDK